MSWATRCSPRPSMSSAPRDAKCTTWCEQLGRAGAVGAVGVRLALGAHERRPAHGARRSGTARPACDGARPRGRAPTTSGMTSPALRTMTRSPGRTSLSADLVLVVQRGHRDRRAGDDHRLEDGVGRRAPRPPDRDLDRQQARGALLGRELARDRPARRARLVAPSVARWSVVVHLDHHAVDVVGEVVAVRLEPLAARERSPRARPRASPRARRRAPRRRICARASKCVARGAATGRLELVGEERQRPRRADRRVLLAQAAGRGVARVGELACRRARAGAR